ncbi:MAG: spore germination protein [Mediterraneibacter gnavus]
MNQQTLAEAMFKRKWFNPFPKFKFTERPDTAVACLLEGKVVILVDNSPSAMILPTSILDMIEEANDYYFPTVTGDVFKDHKADHHNFNRVYDTGISAVYDESVLDPQYV